MNYRETPAHSLYYITILQRKLVFNDKCNEEYNYMYSSLCTYVILSYTRIGKYANVVTCVCSQCTGGSTRASGACRSRRSWRSRRACRTTSRVPSAACSSTRGPRSSATCSRCAPCLAFTRTLAQSVRNLIVVHILPRAVTFSLHTGSFNRKSAQSMVHAFRVRTRAISRLSHRRSVHTFWVTDRLLSELMTFVRINSTSLYFVTRTVF